MANNPTTNKQLNRPDYNDQNWNTPLNNSTTIIDQCLGTTLIPAVSTNTYTLSSTDIQNMHVNLTGTLSATGTVHDTCDIWWLFDYYKQYDWQL